MRAAAAAAHPLVPDSSELAVAVALVADAGAGAVYPSAAAAGPAGKRDDSPLLTRVCQRLAMSLFYFVR